MFARSGKLLKRGGLLFVRVNSASTDVYHSHRVVERDDRGGFTVMYNEGPKRGLAIHFLSLRELGEILDPWFTALVSTREQVTLRQFPKRGSWAQWEGVWVRRVGDVGRASVFVTAGVGRHQIGPGCRRRVEGPVNPWIGSWLTAPAISGSQRTMSASEPTAIVPLRG